MKELKNLIPLIILNWNGEYDSIACLKSIKESDNSQFLTVLVDNGSNESSINILTNGIKSIFSNILYLTKDQLNFSTDLINNFLLNNEVSDCIIFIKNEKNLGFAKGNNVGLKIGEIINCNWAMLLNNDTEIECNSLTNLLKFKKENPEIKAITPEIRFHHQKDKIWNCGGELTYFGSRKYLFANQSKPKKSEKGYSIISFITGCALLFQYKLTGPLSEDFFFGEEDYEFSLRLKKNHMKMACTHNSIIYHKVGSSIKKTSGSIGTIYLYYINRLINTRNYYSNLRWTITKLLAYLYLPILFLKNKLNPINSISLIFDINKYINKNKVVPFEEFQNATRK